MADNTPDSARTPTQEPVPQYLVICKYIFAGGLSAYEATDFEDVKRYLVTKGIAVSDVKVYPLAGPAMVAQLHMSLEADASGQEVNE